MTRQLIYLSALIAVGALHAGCVDSNSRVVLADDQQIEAFAAVPLDHGTPDRKLVHDPRSIKTIDRGDWALKTFTVPVDGTRHRNTYRSSTNFTDQTRRQRGEYPTTVSVLNGDGSAEDSPAQSQRIAEAFIGPAEALLQAFLLPFRLIGEPQTWENFSPGAEMSYERQPAVRSQLAPPEFRTSGGARAGSGK